MPSLKKSKTLAEQIADLQDVGPRDFDPEDDGAYNQESGGSGESGSDSEAEDAGREHYEEVGKSRLRKSAAVKLGAAYRGSKVSRDMLEDSEDNDPFAQNYESSVDEAGSDKFGEVENRIDDSDEISDEDHNTNGEKMSEVEGNGDDTGEDEDEVEDNDTSDLDESGNMHQRPHTNGFSNMSELRRLVIQDQKAVTSTLSQAVKTDVEKGNAIRTQRRAFDALLNVRIKLQPGLVATNSMLAAPASEMTEEASQAIAAAESAARQLWGTIDALKNSIFEAKTGQKRKHLDPGSNSQFSVMWKSMQQYETDMKRQRNSNLDIWASRTRATINAAQGRRLNDTIRQQTLTDVLDGQLSEMSRLVAKTIVPRSCAPVQAAASKQRSKETEAESENTMPIYDDADFYGPLLQTLIAQRSSDAAALSAMNVSFVSQPWQAMREAKTKKMVDTKASKGRKLRYTVHEKLQNIMASENRAMWSDRQCDELFASLQGRRVVLQEDNSDDEQDIATESLRLFAS